MTLKGEDAIAHRIPCSDTGEFCHKSGRHILEILRKQTSDYTEEDLNPSQQYPKLRVRQLENKNKRS